MLRSRVVAGQQIMTDVRPKELVEFSWQTISSRGFVIVEVFERICAFFFVYLILHKISSLLRLVRCYVFCIKKWRVFETVGIDLGGAV